MDIDDDDFLPDLGTSDTENRTTTEPEKTPEHGISIPEEIPELDITPEHYSPLPEEIPVPEEIPELDITPEHYSPLPEEIPVPEDSPEPDDITPGDTSPQRYLLT